MCFFFFFLTTPQVLLMALDWKGAPFVWPCEIEFFTYAAWQADCALASRHPGQQLWMQSAAHLTVCIS